MCNLLEDVFEQHSKLVSTNDKKSVISWRTAARHILVIIILDRRGRQKVTINIAINSK